MVWTYSLNTAGKHLSLGVPTPTICWDHEGKSLSNSSYFPVISTVPGPPRCSANRYGTSPGVPTCHTFPDGTAQWWEEWAEKKGPGEQPSSRTLQVTGSTTQNKVVTPKLLKAAPRPQSQEGPARRESNLQVPSCPALAQRRGISQSTRGRLPPCAGQGEKDFRSWNTG